MAAALTVLLIGCLLQTALCGQFKTIIPQTIKVLSGSCVTIPCSFDVEDQYISRIDGTCRALWKNDQGTVVFDSSNPQSSAIQGELKGDLTRRDCSTTLNNMRPEHSKEYCLRVQCDQFKHSFRDQKLHISVTDDPPTPTLTPSTLKVEEGTSVSLKCSAPAPCLSHPPALTWTSSLGHIQDSLQENLDRTKVQTSVLNFNASRLHHGQITCTAVYNKQDGSSQSVSTSLTADVSWSSQFITFMPHTIEVLSGSCVTIPCSFGVEDTYKSNVDETCRAVWKNDQGTVVFNSRNPQTTGHLTGNLTNRDCTTTLNNMRSENSMKYFFGLECDNGLKYDFKTRQMDISVKDDPPTPTLTPSTLKVEEGTSVSLKCSAPAPCLSHPPALTWTSSLGHIQDSLQESHDRTKVQTSVLTFTASRLHHGKIISCTAVYSKQDGSSQSVSTSLTADVSWSSQFIAFMPQTIEVLSGSCVTIPCSFDVEDTNKSNVDETCRAVWKNDQGTVVFNSQNPQTTGHLTGNLTNRDCTTTLNNMRSENSMKYFFGLECDNGLKYDFKTRQMDISVKDDPPTPTLTPSTLKVEEGTSVSLKCSAPAPCLSHPPALTWTSSLGHIRGSLQENLDRTKVQTSVLTFTASRLHHGKIISCTAVYSKQEGSSQSVSTSLTADVSWSSQFIAFMTQTIEVLSGSCVTIPCSYDVEDTYKSNVDETCRAVWKNDQGTVVFNSRDPQTTGHLTGNLKNRDCTTILNNMRPKNSMKYFFGLECDNGLEYDFKTRLVDISVKDDPPTPTLTPSTLKVEEGTSVSLKCSAPAPCLSHPPALTWTSSLGHIQDSLQENLDRTKVQTSVLNFTASRLHHGKIISCTAVYNKQDGSSQSVSTSLTADVSWSSQFITFMPQTIEVLSGSCVTIPCSFGVEDKYKSNMDETCRAVWKNDQGTVVFNSRDPQTTGHLTGILKNRDCTTTLNNMRPENSMKYFFRLECDSGLKYDFKTRQMDISVKADDPPTPTLTPSTLKVEEGTSVSLKCSAPAPCLSHPPALTWTSSLGHIQDSLQENLDRTKVQTSVLTFTASRLHHGQILSCTAVYNKQEGSSQSVSTSLTADVSWSSQFIAFMPQTIEVLSGSCVTIPCSYDVEDTYKSNVDETCRAVWKNDQGTVVFNSRDPQTTGHLTGNLTNRDCTTTLNNMRPENSMKYFFGLECDNGLEYDFKTRQMDISVKDDPPTPTLTPSTLKVEEGTSVSLKCSAPAPCLSHPPALTWTSSLGHIQHSLQENQDRTKVQTSVLTFTASRLHHGKIISCTAVYNKQDGSSRSVNTSLTADVSLSSQFIAFMPQTIEVLSGSCVTIPCSFGVEDKYKTKEDETCRAVWKSDQGTVVFNSRNPQTTGHLTGNLTNRDCTTTLNNMRPKNSMKYFFRLECDGVQYNFLEKQVDISVKDDPPTPTLTPSTLKVEEGTSVSLKCSAPAPCLSHPPALTWTSSLGYIQDSPQENLDRTKVQTSVLTFTASRLHHGQIISCTAVYNKQDGSSQSVSTSLTADVSYSPKHTTVSVSPSGPVPENSIVTLTCSSTANPSVRSYTWYRADGGQETVMGTGHVLNIKASRDIGPFFCKAENAIGSGRSNISQIDVHSPEQYLGPYSGLLLLAGAAVSLCVNVLLTVYVVFLCKARKSVKPKEEDRTYMSLERRDLSPEYDVIGHTPKTEMAAALTVLLIGCLLQTALCGRLEVFIPKAIIVLSGSCVTIPCSFNVEDQYISRIDGTCRALWKNDQGTVVFDSSNPQSSAIQGELKGDLTRRDCSTTLNNMRPEHSKEYYLKVQCDQFRYSFLDQKLHISVTDSPKHTSVSFSPSGPVPENSRVTLTCSSTANPAVKNYTWYRADGGQETVMGTGHVLNIKASRDSGPFFCEAENAIGSERSNISQIDVHFAPQILSSYGCIQTADQLNCSCETVGNPPPALQWYSDGLPVNHSDRFAISSEPLNVSGLRSIITVSQLQQRDLSTLLCHSSNSLGSATQRFLVYSLEPHGPEQYLGSYSGLLLLAGAAVSLCVNVFFIVYVVLLCKARKSVKPKEEDRTYMSLERRDLSPEYDVIGHTPKSLTWTSSLGHIQDSLQESLDRTKVQTSVLNFTASNLHHGKIISCTAVYNKQDGSSQSVSSSLTADVSYSPKNTTVSVSPSGPVPENSRVTLTRSSTANPAVRSYTWYRADGGQEVFMGSGNVLDITASEVRGSFLCKAENQLGAESDTRQIVQYSPKNTTVSVSPSGPVPENSIVTLTCSSTANPAVKNYTWYRADRGQETVMGTGHVLNIKASRDSVAPQILSSYGCIQTADQLNCSCETVGNPPPALEWYLDGLPVNHSDRFAISSEPLNISAALCGQFKTIIPQTIKVLSGSCVTIPCSFDVEDQYISHIDGTSLTWTSSLGHIQDSLQENLDRTKVQTSVLNFTASRLHHGKIISCTAVYSKQDGSSQSVSTSLTADVLYSPKNTTVSVSPSGPVPENSRVTLTCSSTANPAVRSYTWYRADGGQETVMGTGHVLNIKASRDSGPFFCEAENAIGSERSNISQKDVHFAPQILSSYGCIQTADQLNCFCETVGNPPPALQWYLDGLPVNHSDRFAISSEPLNISGLRSIITVSQPQQRDLSTLLCHSSNSLGSATQRFCVNNLEPQISAKHQDFVMLLVFITIIVALFLVICGLLLVIRAQRTHQVVHKSTGAMSQVLTSGEANEEPNAEEEAIYSNADEARQGDVTDLAANSEPNSANLPGAGPNNAEGAAEGSEKKKEEGSDGIYST
ncbi:LOW QUALITY PROTEIN: uncharacterized protein AB9X84_023321 [Acanthopagrus schlegelii]